MNFSWRRHIGKRISRYFVAVCLYRVYRTSSSGLVMRSSSSRCARQPILPSARRRPTPATSTPSHPFHLYNSTVHIATGSIWRKSVPLQHSDSCLLGFDLQWMLRSGGVQTQFNSSSFKTADFCMMLNLNFGFRPRVSARNFCANFPHFLSRVLVIKCYCCFD